MASLRISESVWRERVAQWRDSGQPIHDYAEQYNVPAGRLHFWARRVKRETQPFQLVPVRVQRPAMPAELELRGP
jgi:hypothetical protein